MNASLCRPFQMVKQFGGEGGGGDYECCRKKGKKNKGNKVATTHQDCERDRQCVLKKKRKYETNKNEYEKK